MNLWLLTSCLLVTKKQGIMVLPYQFHENFRTSLNKGFSITIFRSAQVTRRDNQTLEVDFHVLVEENQDIEQDIQTFRTNLRSDMDEATLTYQDTAFIPQVLTNISGLF